MTPPLNILLVEDNPDQRAEIETLIRTMEGPFELDVAETYESAMEEIRLNGHNVYLVSKEFSNSRGLEIVWELSGRGCKGPAVVIADDDNHHHESEAVNLGAMIYLVRDQLNPRFLTRMIRHAIDRKRYEDNIRNDQEDLIQRMMDLQDSSERYEAQSAEYIQMAEDLAIAQGELEAALAEVTESKKELEKLNKEKDRFFSIIAHDLRSPFTSLLGYTGMFAVAADKMSPEKVMESAGNIDEAATRVFTLLENLLEWAELQREKVASRPVKLDMHALVGKTVGILGPVGADKGVSITNNVPDDLLAFADEHMIDTVIRNLINNATKFTEKGGTVSIEGLEKDGRCEITVSDTGLGLTQDQIDNMFSLGEKISTRGTDGETGTGLGLLLCKDFLEKCSGTIDVESTLGKGSIFTITLPMG